MLRQLRFRWEDFALAPQLGSAVAFPGIELNFNNEGKSLMHNNATLAGDAATNLLLAGKRGVPAGGWPGGSYTASVKVTRDGKTVIEQQSEPIPFD